LGAGGRQLDGEPFSWATERVNLPTEALKAYETEHKKKEK
tara:strand:+ start:15751 stop:15870 length:120 start_codon:yes stop_codon:yes gene_type:complete